MVLSGLCPYLKGLDGTTHLVWFGYSSLDNLNILVTEEATGQQVIQEALDAPEPGDQQLSVLGQEVDT